MEAPNPALSRTATEAIRRRIVDGTWPFGSRLSDRALAELLGVSRTPVREALSQLASEGLVIIRPQSGSFVMDPDAAAIRTICEMRAVLETGALRLAIGKDPEKLAGVLSVALAGAAFALEKDDLERVEHLDEAFHQMLVDASGNESLSRTYRSIADQVNALRHRLPRDKGRMTAALAQHRRIVDLALTDRLPAAEAELATHLQTVQALSITGVETRKPREGTRSARAVLRDNERGRL